MKLLEDRIRKDGKIFEGDVLKVDSFVNHQIDVNFISELGREFKIMSIPALFVIRDGEVTDKVVGYRNKEALLELLEG